MSELQALGELEFKPEDFREYCIKNPGAPHDVCIAEEANRLLRDRLEKAHTNFHIQSKTECGRKVEEIKGEE